MERGESPFQFVSHPIRRAWLAALVETRGNKLRASEAVGIARETPYRDPWQNDPEFQRGMRLVERMVAATLEAEAIRRGRDGIKSYQFHKKTGEPLRHPDLCDCDHHRKVHQLLDPEDAMARGACAECTCTKFRGAPYAEHSYSDALLAQLLRVYDPERFGNRLEIAGAVTNIDINLLPDPLVSRIAQGEHVLSVLVQALQEGTVDGQTLHRAAPGLLEAIDAEEADVVDDQSPTGSDPPVHEDPREGDDPPRDL